MKKLHVLTMLWALAHPFDASQASQLFNIGDKDKDNKNSKKSEKVVELPVDNSKKGTQKASEPSKTSEHPPRAIIMDPVPEEKEPAHKSQNEQLIKDTVRLTLAYKEATTQAPVTPEIKEEKQEELSQSPPQSWLWNKMALIKFNVQSTAAEQARFPQLTIKELRERYSKGIAFHLHPDSHHLTEEDKNSLVGESNTERRHQAHLKAMEYLLKHPMEYNTHAPHAYDGSLYILEIRWGSLYHAHIPGTRNYEGVPTFISEVDTRSFIEFLDAHQNFLGFEKGNPKKDQNVQTYIDYWADVDGGKARIELLAKRLPTKKSS